MCSHRKTLHALHNATRNRNQSLAGVGHEPIRSGSASIIGTKTWYIIEHVLQGHGGLGLGISKPEWNKETSTQEKEIGSDSNTVEATV